MPAGQGRQAYTGPAAQALAPKEIIPRMKNKKIRISASLIKKPPCVPKVAGELENHSFELTLAAFRVAPWTYAASTPTVRRAQNFRDA
jgi:hypothetical protein